MNLNPMKTAPKDGTYVILFGESGYTTTPLRCQVCRYDAEYRPLQPWVTYSNDSFLSSGGPPVGWLPLPRLCAMSPGERFKCAVCGEPSHDQYMVLDSVWAEARLTKRQNCHLLCLQSLIGRPLVLQDFTDAPINDVLRFGIRISC